MRKYRFFYHYNKKEDKMSFHCRKKCYIVDKILCEVRCETKLNKQQPRVVMQGFTNEIIVIKGEGKSAVIIK